MDRQSALRFIYTARSKFNVPEHIIKRTTQAQLLQCRSYNRPATAFKCCKLGRYPRLNGVPRRTACYASSYAQGNAKKSVLNETDASASTSWTVSENSHQKYNVDGNLEPLDSLVYELDQIAPRFELDDFEDEGHGVASNRSKEGIDVIEGPVEFYEVLKTKISQAKRRIYLSTLYIGKTEHELMSTIRTALRENDDLTISFLADALRGTRESPEPTTASLLAPLVTEFGSERVQIRMFHTPNLTGLKKRLLPQRINEGWGLQHMKLYGIDNEIILSGANLSEDYFTNRLDRYHVFRSKSLTDYYEKIHNAISSISFDIQPDKDSKAGFRMTWPSSNEGPSPLTDVEAYISHASSLVGPLILPPGTGRPSLSESSSSRSRTYVYPIFQLTSILPQSTTKTSKSSRIHSGQSTELPAITTLLVAMQKPPFTPAQLTFTAGYFNPSPSLVKLLLDSQQPSEESATKSKSISPSLDVLAASPYANGFYGSKGISGMLPPAYTLLCRRFLEQAQKRGISKTSSKNDGNGSVRLCEWRRGTVGEEGGWTYHAKGIWVTLPPAHTPADDQSKAKTESESDEPGPTITLIGSSNYTQRSYSLDLEANALVLTRNPKLQARLREEVEWLKKDVKEMRLEDYQSTERRVSLAVRLAMWITRVVGGAL